MRRIGRSFITVGLFVLLFIGYQLVGTGVVAERAQKDLASELDSAWAVEVDQQVEIGDAIARVQIPNLEMDAIVVEGVGVADLKRGPGHFPGSAGVGELGNMVIMGHRTTYGAPFLRLDELRTDDRIIVLGPQGPRAYRVFESKVVSPEQVDVVARTPDARLTLTTCHPRFSAEKRLVVSARLEGNPIGRQLTEPDLNVLPDL
jgi:sortase A